jgi:hypothetical protein
MGSFSYVYYFVLKVTTCRAKAGLNMFLLVIIPNWMVIQQKPLFYQTTINRGKIKAEEYTAKHGKMKE